ncbi:MAG: sulfate adenylyltransferase subunit CysN [Ferrovibrio sp.]
MSEMAPSKKRELETFLRDQSDRPTLRFITCGSVDDGKSTLIGRLLYDSKLIFEDQLKALESDSKTVGTHEGGLDFALLVDGLQAEREQGITIDVAYRFFATDRRRFIVADTPGHEQYTRNMATGASTAGLAIILIDARRGVLVQTRRHSYIVSLLGIRHVVLAINKMDLVEHSQQRFDEICHEYAAFSSQLNFSTVQSIPVSARHGDNVFVSSRNMPWYTGPTLMQYLEEIDVSTDRSRQSLRLPVQWVNRPNQDFRGFSGRITAGRVSVGDQVSVYPSGQSSRVSGILASSGTVAEAVVGESITLTLSDEIDISRGDVLASGAPPIVCDQFAVHLLWMDSEPLMPGRQYLVKCGTRQINGSVTSLKYKVDVNTMLHEATQVLALNEIGVATLGLDYPLVCDPYFDSRDGGGFIVIDPFSNRTVGAGIIDFALRRATNVEWHKMEVDKASRAALKRQKPVVLWFTGLSGAGKSTIADLVDRRLTDLGRHTYLLDGDNLRHGLNRDLGFTPEARVENVRRVSEVAKLFVDAGVIVIAALISPFRAERQAARDMLEAGEFIEIYLSTPLEECEKRDPKGLYKKARAGAIPNFTGINSPYEPPEKPDLVFNTANTDRLQIVDSILEYLRKFSYI